MRTIYIYREKMLERNFRLLKLIRIHTTLLFLLGIALNANGQDVQFSQFYQVPTYQNPALAGSAHSSRGTLHQRIQWPGLDANYLTSFASFDTYSNKYKAGFGGYVLYDHQGQTSISSTQVALQGSYELHLSKQVAIRMGLQLGWAFQSVDYSILTFPSQFSEDGLVNNAPQFNQNLVNFFDASSGLVLYTTNLWVGASFHHMNLPNISFLGDYAALPLKTSLSAGYKIIIQERYHGLTADPSKEVSISPTFLYKMQGKSDQFDLGLYGKYHQFLAGIWYRGIPFKVYQDFQNNESLIFLLGMKLEKLSITYSYDATLSTLGVANTGGSHEINLTYLFKKPKKRKKPTRRMPCPSFYVH